MKLNFTRATTATTLLLALPTFAGDVNQLWVDRYHGPGGIDDYARDIAVDSQGNIIVAGITYEQTSSNTWSPRYVTLKFDSAGNRLWENLHSSGTSAAAASKMIVDDQDNIYVTGGVHGSDDWGTIQYAPDGSTVWSHIYEADSRFLSQPDDMTVDAARNVYLTGDVGAFGAADHGAIVKIDNDGTTAWAVQYIGPDGIEGHGESIAVDAAGHVVFTGGYASVNRGGEMAVAKFDSSGNMLWEKTHGSFGRFTHDFGREILVDSDSNVIAAGIVGSNSIDGLDIYIVKYDPDGNELWDDTFGQLDNNDSINAMVIDGDGNIIIAGYAEASSNNVDALVVKYSPDGTLLWSHELAGEGVGNDIAYDVAVDASGNIFTTGVIETFSDIDYLFTMKLSPAGDRLWTREYAGPQDGGSRGYEIAIGSFGRVYVAGDSWGGSTEMDLATVAYEDDPGETESAVLDAANITFGSLIAGDIDSLRTADDVYLRAQSQFGFLSSEPNVIVLNVAANVTDSSPASLELSVEAQLNNPGGSMRLRLRDWDENSLEEVHSYTLGTTEVRETASITDAAQYIRDDDGRIELSIKSIIVATFSLSGFQAAFDQIDIAFSEL